MHTTTTDSVKLRVQVIEDEPKLAQLLIDYLSAAGYHTDWVSSGREALQRFTDFQPNLVLLDLMLPGRDGLDVCKDIQSSYRKCRPLDCFRNPCLLRRTNDFRIFQRRRML